jgi:hypothetical protein
VVESDPDRNTALRSFAADNPLAERSASAGVAPDEWAAGRCRLDLGCINADVLGDDRNRKLARRASGLIDSASYLVSESSHDSSSVHDASFVVSNFTVSKL